jgi:hypothetical protein
MINLVMNKIWQGTWLLADMDAQIFPDQKNVKCGSHVHIWVKCD